MTLNRFNFIISSTNLWTFFFLRMHWSAWSSISDMNLSLNDAFFLFLFLLFFLRTIWMLLLYQFSILFHSKKRRKLLWAFFSQSKYLWMLDINSIFSINNNMIYVTVLAFFLSHWYILFMFVLITPNSKIKIQMENGEKFRTKKFVLIKNYIIFILCLAWKLIYIKSFSAVISTEINVWVPCIIMLLF